MSRELGMRTLGWLLAGWLVVVLAGCGGPPGDTGASLPQGVPQGILIVVLGHAGYGTEAAGAAVDRFGGAADAVVFERHYAASPETTESVRSLLNGFPPAAAATGERPSLAQSFARMGYRTFAVVGDPLLATGSGVEAGFDPYLYREDSSPRELIEETRSQIEQSSGPFLGLLHLPRAAAGDVATLEAALDETSARDRMLLVVTADHGPSVGAEASLESRFRETAVRVPMVVRFPHDGRPETLAPRTSSLTSALDVVPSLLAIAGRDVSGALPGSNVLDGRFPGFALIESGDAWAFVQDNYKLVIRGEQARIYDLEADPRETSDVAAALGDRARGLMTVAIETRRRASSGIGGETEGEEGVDPETLEHLRSLGYVQ